MEGGKGNSEGEGEGDGEEDVEEGEEGEEDSEGEGEGELDLRAAPHLKPCARDAYDLDAESESEGLDTFSVP